ncbi:hypothetical protein H0H87_010612 [Tephrocybe sp. NHM501043]|nr:hypothetical protein H0H87_010612 [Tephrocybe sp. NHM501043]
MGNQSLDMGYEKRIGPKDWRRNVGNTVNEQASEPVRDQIMRHHAGSDTFRSSYLNQKVQFDVQNAVLGEPLETQLLSMLSHVGHLRDPRASSNMVPKEVWAQLPPDSEIVGLQQRRALLKGAGLGVKDSSHKEEIDRLTARINALGGRRRKAVRAWYRKWYFDNRPTWDLARQAHGEAPVGNDKPEIDVQLRPRARLAELLCDQPDDLGPEELSARRVEVGNHMVDLGRLREGIRPEIESFLASYSAAPNAASQPPAPDFDDLARGGSLSFAGAHSHISN